MFRSLMLRKRVTAIFTLVSMIFNIFSPAIVALSLPVAVRAQEASLSLSFNSTTNVLSLGSSFSYSLYYQTGEKIEAVTGTSDRVFLGSASSDGSIPHDLVRGILKLSDQTVYFVKNNSSITTVASVPSSSSDLSAAEESWLSDPSTYGDLKTDVTYHAPFNQDVTVTFATLPENPGTITFNKILLTEPQIKESGALSSDAFEITSTMTDGTFTYSLTLPNPSRKTDVGVEYSEDGVSFTPTQNASTEPTKVTIKDLNHFTIFVVSNPPISSGLCVSAGATAETGCHTTIQSAIDAALSGDTIRVYPGTYSETATNRTVLFGTAQASGPYQFGLFLPIDKPGLKIVGVDSTGTPIASANSPELPVITTNATNNFGTSGIWVEGDNVTIQGLKIGDNASGNNKTFEVVGDNFTLQYTKTNISNGGGSVYINDWTTAGDRVKSYHILDNVFPDGTSVDVASGAGNTGLVSGREILRNTFDLGNNGYNAISFSGSGGVAWFVLPVGGATIKNNSFTNSIQYIRARGTYDNSQFDWESYWNDNTFSHGVVAVKDFPSFDVQDYSYDSFTNVRRIGSGLLEELAHTGTSNTLLLGSGTHQLSSQLRISKALDVVGAGASTIITKGSTAWTNTTGSKGYAPIITVNSSSNPVNLENFVVEGAKNISMTPSGTDYGHGINVVSSSSVSLKNITSRLNDAAGLIVNSSVVTTSNLNTSANGWYGVNIDKQDSGDAVFNLTGTGVLSEAIQIISDKTIGSTVNAPGYFPRSITGTTKTVWEKDTVNPQIQNLKYYKNNIFINTPYTTPVNVKSIEELTYGAEFSDTGSGLNRTAFVIWDATDLWGPVSNSHKCNWNGSPSTTVLDSSNSQSLSGVLLSKCNPTYSWPSGKYIIAHIVYDNAGNSSYSSASQRFIIDNTGPATPSLVGPSDGASVKPAGLILDWTDSIDDSSPVTYVYQSSYSSAVGIKNGFISPIYNADTATNSQIDASGSADNLYYWQVKACDSLGNCSNWSGPWEITVDHIAPSNPGTPTTINPTNSPIQNWVWGASSDASGSGVKGYWQNIYNVITSTNGGWNWVGNVLGSSTSLTDGEWQLQVKAEDNAGNQSGVASSTTLTVDTIAPAIPTTPVPANNSYITTHNFAFAWSTVTDPSTPVTYEWEFSYNTAVKSDGSFTNRSGFHSLPSASVNSPGTPDNTYYWHVRAIDSVGNASAWSSTWKVTVDTAAPMEPTAIFNAGGTTMPSDGYTKFETFSFNLSSVTATRYMLKYWNNIVGSPYKVGTPWNPTTLGAVYPDRFTQGEGAHYFSFSACDAAGNCSAYSAPFVINYDKTAPTSTISYDITSPTNTDVIATLNPSESVTVTNNGGLATHSFASNGSFTFEFRDAAGNTGSSIATVSNIDKVMPTSTITSPYSSATNQTVITNEWDGVILGTAADANSGISHVDLSIQRGSDGFYWNGSIWLSGTELNTRVSATGSTSWNYSLPTPVEDTYTIISHAIDLAGNTENSYTLTIILDKTIPEVEISLNPVTPDAQNGWYKTQPEVTLTATDANNIASIDYQWDSEVGVWTTYSGMFKPASEGARVLYYRALDLAGNYSDAGIKNIKWDQTDLTKGPENISVSPNPTSSDKSTVTWDQASDNIGIGRYEIQWKLGDKVYTDSVSSDIRKHELNNLTEGVWTVIVRAFDHAGNSKEGSVSLTVDRTAPSAPTLSLTGASAGSASLSWGSVAGANSYVIWYGTTPGTYLYGANVGNVTTYTVNGLGAGSYYFVVKAHDASGNGSANSNEVSTGTITGAPGIAPGTPADGFTEEPAVLGDQTQSTELVNGTESDAGSVLGSSISKRWFWWLPLILIILYLIYRRLRKHK